MIITVTVYSVDKLKETKKMRKRWAPNTIRNTRNKALNKQNEELSIYFNTE
jgi:hypothetical protein